MGQYDIVRLLKKSRELNARDIREKLELGDSAVVNSLLRLERFGFLKKRVMDDVYMYSLTEKGENL